ncbi:hypothetical protein M0R04_10515 [Candidatus Dojkabacteria bacterium]|jgi:hypothetical protein|nr:hypothetical protein [Candidatus Dojkabacteria bacterium]
MASSADVKGFVYKKHLEPGVSNPATIEVTLANSEGPLTIGDAVQWTSGYLTTAATTEAVLGILVGFRTASGENIFKTKEDHGATLSGEDTLTAAADNTTVHKVKGVVIVDDKALFLNTADSTLTAAEVGTYFDTAAGSDQVTGSGSGTICQFQLVELVTVDDEGNADDDAGLFRISESQLGWVGA